MPEVRRYRAGVARRHIQAAIDVPMDPLVGMGGRGVLSVGTGGGDRKQHPKGAELSSYAHVESPSRPESTLRLPRCV